MLWGTLLLLTDLSREKSIWFVKNRSCTTQIYVPKIIAKSILEVVLKRRHLANILLQYHKLVFANNHGDFNYNLSQ